MLGNGEEQYPGEPEPGTDMPGYPIKPGAVSEAATPSPVPRLDDRQLLGQKNTATDTPTAAVMGRGSPNGIGAVLYIHDVFYGCTELEVPTYSTPSLHLSTQDSLPTGEI